MDKDTYKLFESYKDIHKENAEASENKVKYDYEVATAYLPRDIDISTKEGQYKVLDLAYNELVKRFTLSHHKNPERAARNMFMYDEDFPMEVVSQYSHYQKHGFPEVEQDTEKFKEQMPDSKEEYSAHDYAKEMEVNGENEERRLDPKCWSGYHKDGTKMKGETRVNNCVKNEQEEDREMEGDLMTHMKQKGMISKGASTDTGGHGHRREEEEGALPSLYQFHKMLERHDWSYDYSDDSSVWRRGQQQEKAIMDAIKKGGQPYQDLYDKYVNQEKSGEKLEAPQKDKAELEQDRAILNDMQSSIEQVRDKMYSDIDAKSVYHPQQLWNIYYPAINILKVMKTIATQKGYKTLLKSLNDYNI